MRILLPLIKTKLFLLSFLVISSVIIATTIPFEFDKGKEPLTKETKELKKKKNSIQPVAAAVNTKILFAASVNQVTPRSGLILGGTAVTITGSGFTPPNAIFTVKFDGVSATSVVRVSNSVITAVTPAHVAGTVSVTVGINGVETTADNLFTYVCNDPLPLIFTESIGSIPPGPPVSIANHESANGFDYDNYTMSGTGEIRSTPTSTGYLGASDAANVFLTNVPGTYFRIDGINANGYANPQLSFGLFKNTTASDGSDLVVEVSGDGINFTALNFPPLPTGTGTTAWHYRIAGGTIPLSPNLSIRFRQNGSITQYRIDDIRLITSPIISSQPSNIVSCLGNPVSFSVVAIGNDLTYQWRKDGTDINGATASSYSIPSGGYNDAGSYDVIVKETCTGLFTISNAALLTIDLTPPTIIVSGTTLNLGCNPTIPGISGALGSASASDNCGSSTITQSDGPVQSSGCTRSQARRFTATDNTGSTSTAARTVTWVADLTPPVFIGSYATVNLGCNPAAASINAALDGATATDACGSPTLILSDGAVISTGCSRSQTRTFRAMDACGNTSTVSRTVNWFADITPPLLTISGGSLNLGCNPDPEDINAALGVASAFDACAAPTLLTTTGAVVANGCNRSQTRAFTSIDACGNFSSASRTAIWTVDITPPVFVGSYGTINLGCNPASFSITAALDGATATDACGAPTLVSSDGTIVSNGCNRSRTRTFSAIDACGNLSTISRTVTWIADITPPVFIGIYGTTVFGCNPLPGDIFLALGFASASDECSATSITFTDVVFSNGCTRTQVRTFTAFDACGNFSIATKVAIWTEDITPPVFIGSYGTVNLGCNPAAASITAALDGATATDACGALTLVASDGAIVSNGCNRSQTRTFTAIDACGNISTASRTVNWFSDLTPPLLTISGGSLNLGCNPDPDDINAALGVASAFDACAAPTLLTSTGAIVTNGCNRSQTRAFTSIDACGNFSSASRTAIWTVDITPPVFIGSYGTVNLGCNPANPAGSLGGATATEACGAPTLLSSDGAIVSNGCNRSQTRTFTAIDACGNISTASRTVNWFSDLTPPLLTISGGSLNLGCNPDPGDIDAALGVASAFDACAAPTLLTTTGAVVANGCNRSQTRAFTSIDACGNFSSASRTAIWTVDITPPVFIGSYGTVNLGCNPANPAGSLGGATATEACGAPTLLSSDGAIVSNGCSRTQTRTFTAIDACGNISTVSRTVNWFADITPPLLTISGGSLNLGCNPDPGDIDAALGVASAFDACAAPTLLTTTGAVVANGCNRSQTRTFTSIDACGNFSSASRTVTWIEDPLPPLFIGTYVTVNLGCNPANPAASLGGATATEACGIPTLTSVDAAIVSSGCNRSQTRTFRAYDACGNTSSVSRTVNWFTDFTPPLLTISGGSLNLGCNPDAEDIDAALGVASAFDACAAPTLLTSTGAIVTNGCNRSQTRAFTSIDACGNFASASRTVTWIEDPSPPVFIGTYVTVNLGCNPANPAGSLGGATASEACGVTTVTSVDAAIVSNGCNRSQTRTFRAYDACGNTSSVSRTVNWFADITPPVLTISGPSNLGCNPDAEDIDAALGVASAFDACAAPTLLTNTGAIVTNGCNRSQTRTFTSIDACGNFASASRTVTWIEDPSPPVFIGTYVNVNLGCNPANPAGSLGGATASEACGVTTVTSVDAAIVSNGCNRSQTRTFTAYDACGNTSSVSRTVTWFTDITPPALSISSGSLNLGCNPDPVDITDALGTATAFDACGAPTLLTNTGAIVTNGCNRSQTRTFTSIDACGNFASASRTVTWIEDPSPPVFIGTYVTVNLGCNPANPAGSLGGATASEACGVTTVTSVDAAIVSNGCNRSQTRTFRAYDACGNTSSVSRTVNWFADITPPVLTIGGPSNLGCNPDAEDIDAALGVASAFDACAAPTLLTSTGAIVTNGCNRSQTRTFTSIDACGNFASASRTVTWIEDPSPPVFIGTYVNVNLGCNPANPAGSLGGATASEACGVTTVTSVDAAIVSNGCNRSQTRTFRAYDACGNTSSVSRTVNWFADITPPVLTIGGPSNLGCNPSSSAINSALGIATAFDACGSPTLTAIDGPVLSSGCNRTQTRTFTARDGCGNTSSVSRTATWIFDFTPPGFVGDYSTVVLGVDPAASDISAALNGATAGDACGAPTITFSDGPVISIACDRSQTRTFTAIDGCANISTISRTVIWFCGQTRLFPTNPKIQASISPFNVKAIPNPTEHQFTLYLEGATAEKVQIVVYDAIGRQVKKIEKGDATGAIKFGEDLKVGVYFVEVRQGINRKTLKLVKQ